MSRQSPVEFFQLASLISTSTDEANRREFLVSSPFVDFRACLGKSIVEFLNSRTLFPRRVRGRHRDRHSRSSRLFGTQSRRSLQDAHWPRLCQLSCYAVAHGHLAHMRRKQLGRWADARSKGSRIYQYYSNTTSPLWDVSDFAAIDLMQVRRSRT